MLLLIDGHAILHRAFHALPPLTNRAGTQTNAVYGFTTLLLRLLETQKPTHLAVAFDLPQPTFRMQIWTQYQEKRPEMQSNLAEQIPLVHELLDALGIPYFEVGGYEADDVLGTLSTQHESVIIVTGDRDMLQLVNDKVRVLVPVRGLAETKLYDEQVVYHEHGVSPTQWVDVKALKGDASDNYPGVRGIGPKTAQELIAKYKTLENVYKHIDELPPKIKLKLAEGAEMAGLSQKLAKISTDVPIKLNLDLAHVNKINWQKGVEYMRSVLGFRSIADKIEKNYLKKSEIKPQKPNPEQMELI
jgi:DNA polymerase-1